MNIHIYIYIQIFLQSLVSQHGTVAPVKLVLAPISNYQNTLRKCQEGQTVFDDPYVKSVMLP